MRIISGKLRGRNILTKDNMSYKPLTGVIREAVFSVLTSGQFLDQDLGISVLEGAISVDLFGGTGAITFEAISRGLGKGIIIERDYASFDLLKKNVKLLGLESQIELIRGDATALPYATTQCSLAFIDPPFNQGLVVPCVQSLIKRDWLTNDALLVIRTHNNEKFDLKNSVIQLFARKYNNSFLRIYRVQK
jgi:16S rRNA (guanine966-N2)-methyltransferase